MAAELSAAACPPTLLDQLSVGPNPEATLLVKVIAQAPQHVSRAHMTVIVVDAAERVVALALYALIRELQLGVTLELTAPVLLHVEAIHWDAPVPPPAPPPPPAVSPLAVCYDVLQIE